MADKGDRKTCSSEYIYPTTARASFYLGPESPRPFSIISEAHLRRRIQLPEVAECDFGAAYEERICELIDRHLELDPRDKVCYVGSDDVTNLVPMLQQRFCLLQPITSVVPGHMMYAESQRLHRRMPIKIAHVGAEEYFRRVAGDSSVRAPLFDKIILKDAMGFLENPQETFTDIRCLLPPSGKLLIIERPSHILTLPVFRDVTERISETEHSYTQVVRALHACEMTADWSVESIPVVTSRLAWLAMLRHRQPSPLLEITSDSEIVAGLRELSEGALKYGGDTLQFVDRLLLIAATNASTNDCGISRQAAAVPSAVPSANIASPHSHQLRYQMPITDEIRKHMESNRTNVKHRPIHMS